MNRKSQLTIGRTDQQVFVPSTTPSTRHDLLQLQDRFHQMLYDEHALEIGLCAKRRRIYDDLFDELIRMITLECSERGILLARIKNEHAQWMNTYEELYSSGMAYALRQYLYKMEKKDNMEIAVNVLEEDCRQLREEIERESIRFEKLSGKKAEEEDGRETDEDSDAAQQSYERRIIRKNVDILRSTNMTLQRDLAATLNNILSSSIFLGEPINYK